MFSSLATIRKYFKTRNSIGYRLLCFQSIIADCLCCNNIIRSKKCPPVIHGNHPPRAFPTDTGKSPGRIIPVLRQGQSEYEMQRDQTLPLTVFPFAFSSIASNSLICSSAKSRIKKAGQFSFVVLNIIISLHCKIICR